MLNHSQVCIADIFQAGLPWEEDKQPFAWEERTAAGGDAGSDNSDQEPVQQAVPSTSGRRPVWNDPDDMAAQVNIAAQPRLRKLRKTERDGVISGNCMLHARPTLCCFHPRLYTKTIRPCCIFKSTDSLRLCCDSLVEPYRDIACFDHTQHHSRDKYSCTCLKVAAIF